MHSARVPEPLLGRHILGFWAPLAGTWWMMALEGVALSAILARLPDPTYNLAAYGVAFAFAILIESPVILLMSASTAMVVDRNAHIALWTFSLKLIALITGLMVVLVLPPVWSEVAGWLRLEPEIARLVHLALLWLLPWPGAIGDRRYHQGLMIRAGQTRQIAYGTGLRVSAMLITALAFAAGTSLPGAAVAGVALSVGVITEAVAVRVMSWSLVRRIESQQLEACRPRPSQREVFHFYMPLALTSVLALAAQPIITFFVGRAAFAVESLAVLPVLNSLTFLLRALALSYQEVVIALVGEMGEHYRELRRFAVLLFGFVAVTMAVVAFTPLAGLWLEDVAGLSPELSRFAQPALRVFAFLPMLSVLQAFFRSLLVHARRTGPVGWATAMEVVAISLVLILTIGVEKWQGALAAATAVIVGRLFGLICLWPSARAVAKGIHREEFQAQ
jgi:progressive ankylosis protein